MNNTLICPNCNKEIQLTDALTHELTDKIEKSIEAKYDEKIEKEKEKAIQEAKKSLSFNLKDKENENKELKEKNEKLYQQILEMNKTLRQVQEQMRDNELKLQKEFNNERQKIEEKVSRKIQDEQRLKEKEKDDKISTLLLHIEDLKRRAEQGSQQSQGEILELDFEQELRENFPQDEIKEVKKGVRGADVIQIVRTPMNNFAGKIIWETKRTKNWEDKWIDKLKSDQREEKAELAVIITQTLPRDSKREIFNHKKVWITTYPHALSLANLLREQLLSAAKQKAISSKTLDDAQTLFDYMTGHEFAHQMEAIIETYLGLNEQITKEKMAFEKQWKQREMQLIKMYKSVLQIAGSITGIAGSSMPQIKGIDIQELDDGVVKQKLL